MVDAPALPEESTPIRLWGPFRTGLSATIGGLVAIGLGVAVSQLSTVLIYVGFALFAALGLDPVVRFLQRRGISRAWSIVVVYSGFAAVAVGVLLLIVPTVVRQVAQVVADAPKTLHAFTETDFYAWLSSTFGSEWGTWLSDAQSFLTDPANLASLGRGALDVGVGVATTLSGLVIVLVLSLYFLASLDRIKAAFARVFPARSRDQVTRITGQVTDSVGSYLVGMVVLAGINSVVAFTLHVATGLPFAALLGVAAFCITLIPLVGSVLYWVVATSLALFTGWVPALVFGVLYLIYMQVEAYVLTPRVMSRAISIPGSLVVIGALIGGTLLGLLGALIAIPVTASLLLLVTQLVIPRQDAKTSPLEPHPRDTAQFDTAQKENA